jgi:TPP-dependent indolepyruvate ferredoxin oxidoreductase alpha subunit
MAEVKLMKGNEVIAEAAIRCGCDGYFGYPITPQSEVMETLMLRKPWEWWYCRQKANWPRSIWYMAVHLVVKK